MKRLVSLTLIVAIQLTIAGMARARTIDEKTNAVDARAAQLIEQARAAIGGEAKLKAIESLTASGKLRRVIQTQDGESQIEGEIELSLLLPDKYKRVETTSLAEGMAQVERISGFNGEETFSDARSSGGGMVMIRTAPETPQGQAAQARSLRRDYGRLLLGWLIAAPTNFSLEFIYAGDAETKDGKADAIDVKGADGFAARLFLDKQSHRPLMMSYRAPQAQGMVMRTMTGSPEEAEKRQKEVQEEARRREANPQLVDVEVYFSDYRAVDGVTLPHRITRAVNGQFSEEWEMKKFKVNPTLKAADFKK